MYKELEKVQGFKEAFPHLIEELEKGNVWSWDNAGVAHELTDDHKEHIKHLEAKNYKVYAVLSNDAILGGCDLVHMDSYLLLTKEGEDVAEYSDNYFYAFADVVNTTCNMRELGDVFISGGITGGPIRED